MQLLNRTAIIVRAKGRYVEWANTVREDRPKFTIEEARTNPGVYLVFPIVEDEAEPSDKDLIDARAAELFEAELARWNPDESTWPDARTPHAFRSWFDVEVLDAVADMDDDVPIGPLSEDEAVEAALAHCAWCEEHLDPGSVHLVPYIPGEEDDVDPEGRALVVDIDDERTAIAVRADEFELAGTEDEDEEDEDDDESPARRRRDDGDDEENDEDEEDEDDYDEDEEEGWVLACCSERCSKALEEALGERAGVEK